MLHRVMLTAALMRGILLYICLQTKGGRALQAVAQAQPNRNLTQWLCVKVMLYVGLHLSHHPYWRLRLHTQLTL